MGCHRLTYHQKISSKTENTPIFVMGKKQGSDYYLGGMIMPGRSSNFDSYRYGFNGMEHDGEVSGDGNSYTTEFRQYDPRLGRWKSIDPLMHMFPSMSPYVAFANNPIFFIDPYGLAPENGDGGGNGGGETFIGDDGKEYTTTHEGGAGYGKAKKPQNYYRKDVNLDVTAKDGTSYYDNVNGVMPKYQSPEQMEITRRKEELKQFNSKKQPETSKWARGSQKLAENNLKRFGPYFVPGYDILEKLSEGEELDASDWIIEGLALIPVGKIFAKGGKLVLKVGDKTTDITKKNLKIAVCFVAGTPVVTAEGLKPIEEIEVGDMVWAFDEETGDITLKAVYNTVIRETDHLEKLIIGSDTLHTTSNHPFWVSNTWKQAGELVVGDTLTLRNNENLILNYKEKIDTVATVYNFAVSDYATYFVGEQEVLVHNDNICAQGGKQIPKKAQDIYNSISTKIRGQNGYVDLSKFVDGKHGKSGYSLSKTIGKTHGDDAIWKLINKKGKRVATLDSTGKILRK